MFGLETGELLLILLIILLLFGAKKLPELARSLGQSIKELRGGFTDEIKKPEEAKKSEEAGKTDKS
ncbi:MAG TPA: twin-arginine translocase TatA/TatE family subunit [Candidatus Saccharimonadales bacterium]|nr:twin-arginine translocase TatA/TatE family subunit [Candidatus Saccharimonadales bacterium]